MLNLAEVVVVAATERECGVSITGRPVVEDHKLLFLGGGGSFGSFLRVFSRFLLGGYRFRLSRCVSCGLLFGSLGDGRGLLLGCCCGSCRFLLIRRLGGGLLFGSLGDGRGLFLLRRLGGSCLFLLSRRLGGCFLLSSFGGSCRLFLRSSLGGSCRFLLSSLGGSYRFLLGSFRFRPAALLLHSRHPRAQQIGKLVLRLRRGRRRGRWRWLGLRRLRAAAPHRRAGRVLARYRIRSPERRFRTVQPPAQRTWSRLISCTISR